ncbi:hypothetical protein GCM10010358_79520 [Streptomyces minutiscleroticus]|uniref:Uncharacterized protein n=1 Tax=Streptomyces minutiscleroticus TaxID=68238 RepID=A0A918U9G5_9ACTN|nr:contact-dependent growth inhibition system immunity protein [Streptomyces minutiscleroticus]GGY15736.1 hypothetical protein GCM10010358_79520 [Streptomyces minutiscleroticus]
MLSDFVNKDRAIEELEGNAWPPPQSETTSLVRGVHDLRKRPIKNLGLDGLRRLISQDVGLRWLLPVALDYLRDTAPDEAVTGWYDDDLLTAVLMRKEQTWRSWPELARHLNETVKMLTDLPSGMQRHVEEFRTKASDLL